MAFTCLTALLKGAQSPSLPAAQPEVFEHVLEVFCELASAPETSDATLDLLRQVQLVPMQLGTVVALLGSGQVGQLLFFQGIIWPSALVPFRLLE